MRVLDLFSGIGGFSLGLERAGMTTVAFCERDAYCRDVLAKHWPGVPCHEDVTKREFQEGEADVICGGFPCQDISLAGAGAGLSGERSGLYRELVRAIRMVRPRYAIMENVAALLVRGMGTVLGDLAEIGHDAEWNCIPASAIGAPHQRDRLWLVAYPDRQGEPQSQGRILNIGRWLGHGSQTLADAKSGGCRQGNSHPGGNGQGAIAAGEWCGLADSGWWETEPDVGRVADGIPSRVDRLRCLGNAVVPQIPEAIGRAIMTAI